MVKRQVPPDPHDLVQHWTSAGSLGQNPGREVPPPLEHVPVAMQTPGRPLAVHGPFKAAYAVRDRDMVARALRKQGRIAVAM